MGQLVIRGVRDDALETMRELAELNKRSLEAQIRTLIEDTADQRKRQLAAIEDIKRMRKQFEGRTFADSTAMIREDRDR